MRAEGKDVEAARQAAEEEGEKVFFNVMPVELALQVHIEQGDADVVRQILSLNLPFGTPVYRCDYIQDKRYQSEKISELEACLAFSEKAKE